MGVYYLIMQAFSEEKVEVKQAVRRVRMAESFYVDLPTVDRYFAHKLYSYHHNVSTIVTDGPDIIHIRNNLPLNLSRVHVESALYSMQTVKRIGKVLASFSNIETKINVTLQRTKKALKSVRYDHLE